MMASCVEIDNLSIRNQRVTGCLCARRGLHTELLVTFEADARGQLMPKPAAGAVQWHVGKRLPLVRPARGM